MEEINLKELFNYYVSKIMIMVFIFLFVILAGAVYSLLFQDVIYKSNTTLVLTGTAVGSGRNIDTETTITQNDISLNSKLVATYRQVIKSKTVLKEVIRELGLAYTTDELDKMITVSTVEDTEMISISVSGEDAIEIAKIANKLAEVFSTKIIEIYNIDNISIIDKAEVATVPSNMSSFKQLIIYSAIGVVISLGTVFVMFYFDNTLKEQSQLEALGFNVLCTVPLVQTSKAGEK